MCMVVRNTSCIRRSNEPLPDVRSLELVTAAWVGYYHEYVYICSASTLQLFYRVFTYAHISVHLRGDINFTE